MVNEEIKEVLPVSSTQIQQQVMFFNEAILQKYISEKALANTDIFKIKDIWKPGEEHPFDFKVTQDMYQKMGYVTAVIDKYVDFVVGSGFYVKSEDADAQKQIEDFIEEKNFDNVLREWLREALIKGNGFMEILPVKVDGKSSVNLTVVNANEIYLKRDDKQQTEFYTQMIKGMKPSLWPKWSAKEIAHLKVNALPMAAYGIGIVYPNLKMLDNLLGNEKDMHKVISRKAGAPIHLKVGTPEFPAAPGAVASLGKQLEYLNTMQEWATDQSVEIKVIEFGDLGKNFEQVLLHDKEMLMISFQIPQVLLGSGNIAEGLAKVQMAAFERRVQSLQSLMERVIETQIFQPLLEKIGKAEVHVEFEWGAPSDTEVNTQIDIMGKLFNSTMASPKLNLHIQKKLARLLGMTEDEIAELEEPADPNAIDDGSGDASQPSGKPPFGKKSNGNKPPFKKGEPPKPIKKQEKANFYKHNVVFQLIANDDQTIREWLGFAYNPYVKRIIKFIDKDSFSLLKADNMAQLEAGYLNLDQVEKLKDVMVKHMKSDSTIRSLAADIQNKVGLGPLYEMKTDNSLNYDSTGNRIEQLDADARSLAVARTESTRVAAEGYADELKSRGIEQFEWVASSDERTCPDCIEKDGNIYNIDDEKPALHINCRCSIIKVLG